jgi:succinate dehydrogenase hydrophobic anchor subunit
MLLLNPDKNIKLLKLYHYSNKLLIPQFFISYFNTSTNKNFNFIINTLTSFNVSYHSYLSGSMILNDYLQKTTKNNLLHNIVKISNLKLHILATLGYVNYFKRISYDI